MIDINIECYLSDINVNGVNKELEEVEISDILINPSVLFAATHIKVIDGARYKILKDRYKLNIDVIRTARL